MRPQDGKITSVGRKEGEGMGGEAGFGFRFPPEQASKGTIMCIRRWRAEEDEIQRLTRRARAYAGGRRNTHTRRADDGRTRFEIRKQTVREEESE